MSSIVFPYLGKAGVMRPLPSPRGDVTATPDRGDQLYTLLSGGVAKAMNLHAKRAYELPYPELDAASAAILLNFYRGFYGSGPWRFVDPSSQNVLTGDASTFGVRPQVAVGWASTSGAVAKSTTPPTGATDSGVAAWTATAAGKISPSTVVNVADVNTAPVYLPAEPCSTAVWVKVSANSTITVTLTGFDASGVVVAGGPSTALAMTAAMGWQLVSVSAAAGLAGLATALYVLPVVTSSAAVTVSLAGAHLGYASTVPAWLPGDGAPRVAIAGTPGRLVGQPGWSSHTLKLSEV